MRLLFPYAKSSQSLISVECSPHGTASGTKLQKYNVRKLGKRLKDWYGWKMDMFSMNQESED